MTVCSLMLSFCLFSFDSFAATNSEEVMEETSSLCAECETGECTEDTMNLMGERSSVPYCNHVNPTTYPHSSMRYLRTVYDWDIINSCEVEKVWYKCILCGYECFWPIYSN